MSSMANLYAAAESRPLALRVRPDLQFKKNLYQGEASWIVKDPVALKYYRLAEEEFTALQMLDGQTSMEQIKEELERRFPPWIVEYSELQSLLGMFHRCGLVLSDAEGQGEQLFNRRKEQQRRELINKLGSLLWIRLPGWDPEVFLSWLYPKVRWFFTRWFLALWIVLVLSAIGLLLLHLDQFYARLPAFHQFFGPRNVVWLMVALVISKVLHEIGHGLTCKHFGGECHQIGVMLLVFTPCMYCDTSDSWMLGNKWHRAAIGAAGMYVEVLLASICTFIWWHTEPGLVHYVCLSTMFVCSVSTVLFNGNPLLRFDGYYILADILEVPNLAQKSRSALFAVLRTWCLGMPWDDRLTLPPKKRVSFALYAVASFLYRWLIVIGILLFLSKVFKPYGLQALGHLLVGMSLASLAIVPTWQTYRYLRVPGRMKEVKKPHLLATVAIVLAVILAVGLIPVPHRVMATLVVEPCGAERIYVDVPGVLEEVQVEPGQTVEPASTLARLKNLDLELEIEQLQGQCRQLEQQLTNLRRRQNDPEAARLIPQTEEELASVRQQLEQRREDQQRLTLVSSIGGHVMPPPYQPKPAEQEAVLPTWSGSPLEKENLGSWIETGTLFCMVGDPRRMQAVLVIDQSDVEFVAPGQSVEIKLDEYPTHTLHGTIAEVAAKNLQVAPRELSNKAGGDLSTETDPSGAERPISASYQATVPLEPGQLQLLPGFRGQAKIHAGSRTLAQMIWRTLMETFRFS